MCKLLETKGRTREASLTLTSSRPLRPTGTVQRPRHGTLAPNMPSQGCPGQTTDCMVMWLRGPGPQLIAYSIRWQDTMLIIHHTTSRRHRLRVFPARSRNSVVMPQLKAARPQRDRIHRQQENARQHRAAETRDRMDYLSHEQRHQLVAPLPLLREPRPLLTLPERLRRISTPHLKTIGSVPMSRCRRQSSPLRCEVRGPGNPWQGQQPLARG